MVIKYIPRLLEKPLLSIAKQFPVIVLTGPRQTGKSTLLKKVFPKYNYVSLDNLAQRTEARRDPSLFLENIGAPVIIDEIQYAPDLLSYIKMTVDADRGKNGQFILTGSQMFPLMAGVSESLAGRVALFELLGLSWEELAHVKRDSVVQCFKQIYQGFYPYLCTHENVSLNEYYGGYLTTYLERDIRQIRSVHDTSMFHIFLQMLATRAGNLLNLAEISKECGISHATARNWLSLLETTRVVYLLRPYFRNMSKRLVKSPKLYFTDTGLLAHILKYQDAQTLATGPMAGAFFENMVVIEMLKRKFNHRRLYEMYFYRDSNKNEVDLLLDLGQQRFALAEIKMTKNPRPDMAQVFSRLPKELETAERYVLSFSEDKINLSKDVKAIPWWEFIAGHDY